MNRQFSYKSSKRSISWADNSSTKEGKIVGVGEVSRYSVYSHTSDML